MSMAIRKPGPLRISLKGFGCLALFVYCAACVLAPGAALAGTLDQQQTDGSSVGGYAISAAESNAQSFTAGLSGGLDRVDLFLEPNMAPSAYLSVEIRDVSGGAPGSLVLASRSVPAPSIPGTAAFVSINFAPPAPVAAGTQYAIVAYSAAAGSSSYLWHYSVPSNPNPYAAGGHFLTSSSPPSGAWTPNSPEDLAFRTYVVPSTPTSTPTGQRIVALKKCKKKHSKKARKRCRKKAQRLPV
jgi:hypothetical protein